jgi:murein DD-endopeptidase MepM/ murein hydrolase activator NlpD
MASATVLVLAAAGAVLAPAAVPLMGSPTTTVAGGTPASVGAPSAHALQRRAEPPGPRPPGSASRRSPDEPASGWRVVPGAPGRAVVTPRRGWGWPLNPQPAVVATFRAPPTPWGAGHRGVDLAAAVGQPVLAAGGGRVTFAGRVAGRGVVVVAHPGGLRTSYEPVTAAARVGTAVRRADRIAVVAATPGHCAPRTCLHWGLRQGARYVDPLTLVGRGPPVLLPLS